MSNCKTPENRKSRKSLSLSKKRSNVVPKSNLSPGKTSTSPSIITLFKNAPPAKLSCPLCGKMVPRFGLNQHLDEACEKAKRENDDVILVGETDLPSDASCSSPQPLQDPRSPKTKTDLNINSLNKTNLNEKEASPYFKKNAPFTECPKEVKAQVVKCVPLGSLSSKLSRRYQTRSMKHEAQVEKECQTDSAGTTGTHTKDAGEVGIEIQNKNPDGQPMVFLSSEETKYTEKVSICSMFDNGSDLSDNRNDQTHKQSNSVYPKSLPVNDESVPLVSLQCKLEDSIKKAKKHKIDGNLSLKKKGSKKVKPNPSSQDIQQIGGITGNCSVKEDSEPLLIEDASVLDEFLKPFNDTDDQKEGDKLLEHTSDQNVIQQPVSEAAGHPYYLRNFLMVLETVVESEEDMSLFNEDDKNTLTSYYKLSHSELQDLQEALDLLSAPEIKVLAKGFHLTNPGAPKHQLIQEFLRLSKQRSVFSLGRNQPGLAAVILKKAKDLTGQAVRVCRAPRAVFSRVLLLFSLTDSMEVEEAASGGQTQLSTVLMVNMGRTVFPQYTVQRSTRIFQDRDDLIRYEAAMHKLVDIVVAMTNGNWNEAQVLYQNASKDWNELKNESSLRYHEKLPVYLRCFTVGWVYTRILSRGVEILQRLHLYEAVELLQSLLSQHIYCPDSRGRWWDRLVLNLHQHLKRTQKAIGFIMEGLSDPYVRTGHQLSLYQRAVRMRDSPSCKKFHQMFCDLPVIDVEDVPHVTIKGKMCPQTGMGKSVFLMEDLSDEVGEDNSLSTVMCSVEELALAHYRQQGFDQGIHGEGSTFCTLYGLLMWDIIFMEGIPDVFRNPYQAFPLDLYTDCFYENRKDAIENRIQLLRESSTEILLELLADVWNAYEGRAAALISWERFSSLQQAQNLVSCFGGPFLSGVCKKMSKDIRHCRGGLPDLVVWNVQTKQYKLVEVKGPNDRLSHKQMVWLHELKKMGADVEVCHVVSIGAKSNRVG
ncbi:LOW QUALITY PROTEIN: fanconi-associated nuclease 1 [Rhinophrynus dorsalis]